MSLSTHFRISIDTSAEHAHFRGMPRVSEHMQLFVASIGGDADDESEAMVAVCVQSYMPSRELQLHACNGDKILPYTASRQNAIVELRCLARPRMVEQLHALRRCVCSVLIRLIDSDEARPGR